jgi:hypothetical protein
MLFVNGITSIFSPQAMLQNDEKVRLGVKKLLGVSRSPVS